MRPTTVPPIPSTFFRAAFPLGGIGTGTVSIGARGEFRDWELRNAPNIESSNPLTLFAISAEPRGGERITRVLESRPTPGSMAGGFGADPSLTWNGLMGLPRLARSAMRGEYPFVEVVFEDEALPVVVRLTAFTPLVPLDALDSGIPAAVIRYTVDNPGDAAVDVSVAGLLTHVAGLTGDWEEATIPQTVTWRDEGGIRGLDFGTAADPGDLEHGTMSLVTVDAATSALPDLPHGFPSVGPRLFWDTFSSSGRLAPAPDDLLDPAASGVLGITDDEAPAPRRMNRRSGALAISHELAPGESRDFEFVLSWSFPNRRKGWPGDPLFAVAGELPDLGVTRNHYATRWADAWAAASYLLTDLDRLERSTADFHDALYSSTLDPAVLDAVASTIATVRSTTCFRIEDGTFFGWEGSARTAGSCGGTCTHVWSYAQTVAWLFPELERSARRVEFLVETDPDGRQRFRAHQVFGGRAFTWSPAADGQLGTVVRLHREWRFSGDDAFLAELWPGARRSLDYALREWDLDGDGVLDALMHNTYDIEFDGSEPLSNVLLLAALRAAVRMARAVGDVEAAERYALAFDRGSRGVDELLYNGEYYQQRLDDLDARPNQYGPGVLSDQLLGQFQAHVNGLGFVLPEDHVRSAIRAVFTHNFRKRIETFGNVQRAFAIGEEGGLILATWPHGGRPRIPFTYCDESWTGIEYHVAAELVYCGLVDEALALVRAVRARHTGEFRSPWNDIEAGNHYARSMSSWGLLLAFSGAQYDAPARTLSFDPVADGRYLFTTGAAWGTVEIDHGGLTIQLAAGSLDLASLRLRGHDLGPARIALSVFRTSVNGVAGEAGNS